ncbi:TonB-dependent receptor domain-containing protein [Sphingomonas abaci]|uniref:Outer membrane receptor protein involved in Fe transport n=1 Tax=Sphingomonas abaci TaxID=237611 RepID=A0A7W7ALV3_9SPHN|nr:TonB-dependent receptor [Sphingomonas abaci]MBB4618495.1 outer membrane receptor protein involved in Fe transport [Sphingomonas abaci]
MRSRYLFGTALVALGFAIATPAAAQETPAAASTDPSAQAQAKATPADGDEIVVTASRISQSPIAAQPTQSITAETIAKRGFTNLGMALMELPLFSVPGNSPVGGQGFASAGQTFVNMYNLGAQRTLTLVNGNRFVSSASSSLFGPVAGSPVDFSSLPVNLVERVETVSVGGAPIYGSDAIAGTVNVILKRNYQGLSFAGQSGISQRGLGGNYSLSGLVGQNFAEERGNITLSMQYDKQIGIPTSDIYYQSADAPFFTRAQRGKSFQQQLYYGGQRYAVFTNTGMPMVEDGYPILSGAPYSSITDAQGRALFFNSSGALTPFNNGQVTGQSLIQAGGDGFRLRDYGNFLVDSNRFSGTALFHYDFSDSLRFSGEAWYGRSIAVNLRNQPFYSSALFGDPAGVQNGNLALSTANPFLSAADRATIVSNLAANGQPTDTFYMARANTDLATGAFRSASDLYRIVSGFDGDVHLGDRTLTWEVKGIYGRSNTKTTARELVLKNFFNAINAVRDASGNIACAPGYSNATIPTISATCAPLNIFGVNQASQAAINYVTAIATPKQTNIQGDVIADVKGDLIKLPGGFAKFVLGFEHRYESTNFNPGLFYYGEPNGDGTRTQYGNSIPIDPVAGAYHTNEFFGELNVPLVSDDMDVPLIHSLELQGAARYVKNSMTGGFWAYTGGGKYAPFNGLTLRGNYTRSLRAPAITELFAPIGQVFSAANDPCDSRYITGGPNPTQRAANCRAAGLPADFTSNVVDYTAAGRSGGNPNLQNEIGNSWTAGGVFEPRFVPGLRLAGDYVHIDVKNEVASLDLVDVMNACYDSADYPNSPFCSSFTRNASGQVTSFTTGNYNIGIERFRGVQGSFAYILPFSRLGASAEAGTLSVGVNYLHTIEHYYRIGSGDIQYKLGTTAEPKDNFTANVNYDNGGFNLMWQSIYNGPTRINVNVPDSNYEYPRIGAYWMFNTSAGMSLGDRFNIRLIVNNVLDKKVPFPFSVSANRYYDAFLGRSFRVSVGFKL